MTVALVGLPNVVITTPTDAAIQAGITAWLADRTSDGRMRSRLVFAFVGTAKLLTPLLPAGTGQLQGVHWSGMGKRLTVLQWASTEPLLAARGQLRNFHLSQFSLQSTIPDAAGLYLLSSATASNQDGELNEVEWMGSWAYGIGLNGPATANLNSELSFIRCALSNDASFSNAWLWSGMTPTHPQEDQFVNYHLQDCKLEGSHGDWIRMDKGGCVVADGFNSWLHTGQSNDGVPAGTMVVLAPGPHSDGVQMFHATGVRAELRSAQSRLIDSAWGAEGHVTWAGLTDTADAFSVGDVQTATYRGPARVAYRDCALAGWHGVQDIAPISVLYDSCSSRAGHPFQATPTTGTGMLRYSTAAKPLVTAR